MRSSTPTTLRAAALLAASALAGCGGRMATDAGVDGAPADARTDAPSVDLGDDASSVDLGDDAPAVDLGDDLGLGDAGSDAGLPCASPSDCPGTDGECSMRTCVSSVCGVTLVPVGTATSVQTPGDCTVNACDGAGAIVPMHDDGDVFDDGNDCTNDTCAAGTPLNVDAPEGSACASSGGSVCDGSGACVGCVDASTCPGTDTACEMRTCATNTCGLDFVAAGMAAGTQVAGDCHENQCDGAGGPLPVIADGDVPDDGNDCTTDTCSAGVGGHTPTPAGSSCPGGACDGGGTCVPAPVVTSVTYPVIAQGGTLVLTGTGFTGATSVTIGGVAQAFTVGSATQITVAAVSDTTTVGAQPLVVTTTLPSAALTVTVIALQVNELDCNQPTTDTLEFIEIATGVPGVSLAGYTLVFFNGAGAVSYRAIELAATTNASGLLVVGNAGVSPAPSLTFPNDTLQNGPDAVAIYQGPAIGYPTGTAVTSTALIDALVYGTADADDPVLLDALMGAAPYAGRVQADEGPNTAGGASETQSIQRCSPGRRDGRKFTAAAPPTPGAPNGGVAACP